MGVTTNIAWTESTWNPVSGCTQVSPGCDNCYALELAERFRGTKAYPNGFDITLRPHRLNDPFKWKKPSRIFVNSMSDLFHKDIPKDYLAKIWDVMVHADHHIYQILTKRPHRMRVHLEKYGFGIPGHIWLGVSAENQKMWDSRVPELLRIPAAVRFVSAEPLLEHIDMGNTYGLHWVIAGGESGYKRRPMAKDWVRSIRDQCVSSETAFFYKQGSALKPGQDNELDGRTWEEVPVGQANATWRQVRLT